MPIALQVFATAAKDAGLTVEGTTTELFKLMEQGKAAADKILPHVAKGFKAFAAPTLEASLARLSVRLGQATYDLQTFSEDLFNKGVESGLKHLLTAFDELMKSSKVIASFLGGTFEGAILGLVTPFRLLHAAVHDSLVLITRWTGADVTFMKGLTRTTGAIFGMIGGVYALIKALKLLFKAKGLAKGAFDLFKSKGAAGAVTNSAKGGGWFSGMGKRVFVTNMPAGGFGGGAASKGATATKWASFTALLASIKGMLGTLIAWLTGGTLAATLALPVAMGALTYLAVETLPDSMKYDQAAPPTANQTYTRGNQVSNGFTSDYGAPQRMKVDISLDSELLKAQVRDEQGREIGSVFD